MFRSHVFFKAVCRDILAGTPRAVDNKPPVVVSEMVNPAPLGHPLTTIISIGVPLTLRFPVLSRLKVFIQMTAPEVVAAKVLAPATVTPSAYYAIRRRHTAFGSWSRTLRDYLTVLRLIGAIGHR